MTPEAAFALDFFGVVCNFILVVLRLWIQFFMKKTSSGRPRSIVYAGETCIVLAFCAEVAIGGVEYWRDMKEISLHKQFPGQAIDKYVVGEKFSKVIMKNLFGDYFC